MKLDVLRAGLSKQVYTNRRNIFKKELDDGKRLTFEDLRDLDENFRGDYMNAVMKRDEEVQA